MQMGPFHGCVGDKRLPLEDVQADYICVSVIKLPVSTFELTFVAVILGRSMTYDVLHERFPSNGYHVAHRIAIGSPSVCMSIFQPLMLGYKKGGGPKSYTSLKYCPQICVNSTHSHHSAC